MTIVQKTSSELASAQLARLLTVIWRGGKRLPIHNHVVGALAIDGAKEGSNMSGLGQIRFLWQSSAAVASECLIGRLASTSTIAHHRPVAADRLDGIRSACACSCHSGLAAQTARPVSGECRQRALALQRHSVLGRAPDRDRGLRRALSAEDPPAGQLILNT